MSMEDEVRQAIAGGEFGDRELGWGELAALAAQIDSVISEDEDVAEILDVVGTVLLDVGVDDDQVDVILEAVMTL